jgi:hypothetical protein
VLTRIAVGRARVVREVRAAAPLMADLRAPVTARGPWLTAVLNEGAARRGGGRPVAVVVEPHAQGRPEAVAFLTLRRRGLATVVTVLGDGVDPVPAGRPPPACSPGTRRSPDCSRTGSATCWAACAGEGDCASRGCPWGTRPRVRWRCGCPTA